MSQRWREAGEKHYQNATPLAAEGIGASSPTVSALLAVYCELRHQANERTEYVEALAAHTRAMDQLSGMLDEHSSTLGRLNR